MNAWQKNLDKKEVAFGNGAFERNFTSVCVLRVRQSVTQLRKFQRSLTLSETNFHVCPITHSTQVGTYLCTGKSHGRHAIDSFCYIEQDKYAEVTFSNGESGLFYVYLRYFNISIQMTNIQFELFELKKLRCCVWDLNPGPQDGGC